MPDTFPTLTVRAALATAAFSATPTWSTLTSDAREIAIKRGRQHELDRIEAGTCSVAFNNLVGNYWPGNSGGAYYPNVLPGKRVNVRAVFDAVTYDLYTGFLESWQHSFEGSGDKVPRVVVRAADLLKNLNLTVLNGAYPQEFSDVRVGKALDALGWPAGNRDISAGATLLPAQTFVDKNALEHLHEIQQSELGVVFVAGDGDVQFHDRQQRTRSPYTVSQATFGDDAGEMGYTDIEFEYSDKYIYNSIQVTMIGGVPQLVSDATSISAYGKRSLVRDNLLFISNRESENQANRLLTLWKNPQFKPRAIVIRPQGNPTNLFPKVLSYDIGTRLTLRLDKASIDKAVHIEGIRHTIRPKYWETRWELSDAEAVVAYWLLGTSTLGIDTTLGY